MELQLLDTALTTLTAFCTPTPSYLMVTCHQFSLFIVHHVGIVLVMAISRTCGAMGIITWLFVPNICQDIDRVAFGQAAESYLYWCVTKSKSNFNEDISVSQTQKNK